MSKYLLFLISIAILFSACNREDPVENNCDKEVNLEEYLALEDQCRDSEYNSVETIRENLIGEWQLLGIYSVAFDSLFQECIMLEIDENNIVLKNLDTGEEKSTEWKIESYEVNSYTVIYLRTDESFDPISPPASDVYTIDRLGMETFSENLMFGTGRVDDAGSYLYEKVQ